MKVILLIFLVLTSFNLAADETQTLLSGDIEVGGFGGPMLSNKQLLDRNKVLVGGQGAVLINKSFYIGGGGGGTVSDIGGGFSSYSYGGLILGSFIKPRNTFHYFIDIGVYSGNLSKSSNSNFVDASAENFLILEPSTGVAVNILKYIKGTLGVSYSFISSFDSNDVEKNDLEGISIKAGLLFGTF